MLTGKCEPDAFEAFAVASVCSCLPLGALLRVLNPPVSCQADSPDTSAHV